MYKICTTQTARQRQRELENGLLRFMLHHQYENIIVSELCDSLQIPRKAFYRYFSSKEGEGRKQAEKDIAETAQKQTCGNHLPGSYPVT